MKKLLWLILFLPALACGQWTIDLGNPDNPNQSQFYVAPDGVGDNDDPGTVAEPWATLEYAVTQASSGNIIIMKAGTHTLADSVSLPVGVNLAGQGAGASTILSNFKAGASNYYEAAICLHSASEGTDGNQYISDLTIDGNDSTGTKGIVVLMRSNVTVKNCTIKDFENGGLMFIGQENLYVKPLIYASGNSVYDCVIQDNSHQPGTNGEASTGLNGSMMIGGQTEMAIYNNVFIDSTRTERGTTLENVASWLKNSKIHDNDFYRSDTAITDDWSFHMEMWRCDGGVEIYNNNFYGGYVGIDFGGRYAEKGDYTYSFYIHDNYFYKKTPPALSDGHVYLAVDAEGGSSDVIISENYAVNFGGGVHVLVPWWMEQHDIDLYPRRAEKYKIYNNIFENVGYTGSRYGAGITFGGDAVNIADTSYVRDVQINNNVITTGVDGTWAYAGIWIVVKDTLQDVRNITIKNNIVTNAYYGPVIIDGSGDAAPFGIVDTLDVNYNLFYNTGNSDNILTWNPSGVHTDNITELNTVKTDPLFYDEPNSYRVNAASDAVGGGIVIPGYITDYEGVTVSNPPNIGAYETTED